MTISTHQPAPRSLDQSGATSDLNRFGIDSCGAEALVDSRTRPAFDPVLLHDQSACLQKDMSHPDSPSSKARVSEVVHCIVRMHHSFARSQLSLIRELATKVERHHGYRHPEIFQVSEAFAAISTELSSHLFCEENILFPYLAHLETEQKMVLPHFVGGLKRLVHQLVADHVHTHHELRLLREITGNYTPPADADSTYRALYGALKDFDRDIRRHIHVEDNIVFPRALGKADNTI